MGRRSTKPQKNMYQLARENAHLTREKASEKMDFVSESRIVKIEGDQSEPRPEEILAMASAYQQPDLVYKYCSEKCPIGKVHVPPVKKKELAQIVVEVLASLHSLDERKNRLIEISADGKISDDELADFAMIRRDLKNISETVSSLQLWVDTMVEQGLIDLDKLEKIQSDFAD